jgi:ketosteroid isomerase-like protein
MSAVRINTWQFVLRWVAREAGGRVGDPDRVLFMEEGAELKDFILTFYKAVATGDMAVISEMTADEPGMLFVGTDADEWWESRERLAQAASAQHAQIPEMTIQPGTITAYRQGDFGFVADRPSLILADGTAQSLRFTAVLRRDAEGWKLVQGHTSIGVPNEDVLGRELST